MDNQINPELLEALQGIHDELKRMNQTLAKISTKPAERPAAATSAAPSRSYTASPRPYGAAGRVGSRGSSSYSRPSRPAQDGESSSEGGSEFGSRFPKKKGSTRSSAGPARSKGKLPPKKGNGYPKKPKV